MKDLNHEGFTLNLVNLLSKVGGGKGVEKSKNEIKQWIFLLINIQKTVPVKPSLSC